MNNYCFLYKIFFSEICIQFLSLKFEDSINFHKEVNTNGIIVLILRK